MNNVVFGKAMENIRNRIDAKLVSIKKLYLNLISKLRFMSQNIFDNDLATIRKNKVLLMLTDLHTLDSAYQNYVKC